MKSLAACVVLGLLTPYAAGQTVPCPPSSLSVDGGQPVYAQCPRTFRLEAKSFINKVNFLDGDQFSKDISCLANAGQRATAFAVWMGTCGAEDPEDGTVSSMGFRLRSAVTLSVDCTDSAKPRATLTHQENQLGTEFRGLAGSVQGGFQSDPRVISQDAEATIHFAMVGRPADFPSWTMEHVKSRECLHIWHEVTAHATCKNGVATLTASIRGSRFPSHRLWIDGKKSDELVQGPYAALWACETEGVSSWRVREGYGIRGEVTGLAGSGLILANSGDVLAVTADGTFRLPMLERGAAYQVHVKQQPSNPPQVCSVTNGIGTVTSSEIENIRIGCRAVIPPR